MTAQCVWDVQRGTCLRTYRTYGLGRAVALLEMDTPLRVATAMIKPCGYGMCEVASVSESYRTYMFGYVVAFSDGQTLATGTDLSVRLWNVQDGTCLTLHVIPVRLVCCFQPQWSSPSQ